MGQLIDMKGKQFSNWTVMEISAKTTHKKVYWDCQCKCGRIIPVDGTALRSGKSKGCGCERLNRRLPDGVAAFNALYRAYEQRADNRGYSFDLTKDEFKKLVTYSCKYCGEIPRQEYKSKTTSFIYNGVDRVNNSLGYSVDNCVPCCKLCNSMKERNSALIFINHCKKVVDYNER